jgi:hypothetical protein
MAASNDYEGKHEAEVIVEAGEEEVAVPVEVEATVVQTVPSTPKTQLAYYAKAIVGALVTGLTYLLTVLTPAATLGDITLVQWIGFLVSTLGTFAGVAYVTNGPKPTK